MHARPQNGKSTKIRIKEESKKVPAILKGSLPVKHGSFIVVTWSSNCYLYLHITIHTRKSIYFQRNFSHTRTCRVCKEKKRKIKILKTLPLVNSILNSCNIHWAWTIYFFFHFLLRFFLLLSFLFFLVMLFFIANRLE